MGIARLAHFEEVQRPKEAQGPGPHGRTHNIGLAGTPY